LFLVAIFGLLLLCLTPVMVDADATQGSIVYIRDQLLKLQMCGEASGTPEIPRELRRKYQGCRAGRRRKRIFLPTSWGMYDRW